MDEIELGLDKMQTNSSKERSFEKPTFFRAFVIKNATRIETDENNFFRLLLSVCYGDLRSELSLQNNWRPDCGTVIQLYRIFSGHAVKFLLDLVTETLVRLGQPSAFHEAKVAVSPKAIQWLIN